MSSQFEKRKAKAEAAIKEKRDKIRENNDPNVVEDNLELTVSDELPVTLPNEGYDIFLGPDGRKYQVVVFKYDPVSGEVRIEDIVPVQRQVALMYANQKHALKTLIKRS